MHTIERSCEVDSARVLGVWSEWLVREGKEKKRRTPWCTWGPMPLRKLIGGETRNRQPEVFHLPVAQATCHDTRQEKERRHQYTAAVIPHTRNTHVPKAHLMSTTPKSLLALDDPSTPRPPRLRLPPNTEGQRPPEEMRAQSPQRRLERWARAHRTQPLLCSASCHPGRCPARRCGHRTLLQSVRGMRPGHCGVMRESYDDD